ncbi:hypothetical protein [Spiroplasma endosymbiont of Lariophagus distinguendus]|uniref:hypothetical protein n=1 Tax=Spiroplasma endosymbiont of Lariophagus distinguendus TaxID=2935082 RepID=UPI002079C34A|nr:hypothetical protein [Spiroplasma endosymbiont of Lariophagus distinguendus]
MDKDKEIEKLRKQDAENKKQFEEERLKKRIAEEKNNIKKIKIYRHNTFLL